MDRDTATQEATAPPTNWWEALAGRQAAEVDAENATGLIGLLALATAAFEAIFLLVHRPIHGVGSFGWVLAGVLITGAAITGWSLHDRRDPLAVGALTGLAAAGMAQVSVISLLTAGEPERQLIGLWLGLIVAINPLRRLPPALGLAYLAGAISLLTTHIDTREGAQLLADGLVWAVIGAVIHLLLSSVRRQCGVFRQEREALDVLARRDELTSLGNRRALQEALERLERSVLATREPATIAIFDIENFKQINDVSGLAAGDDCLRSVGSALGDVVEAPTEAFRWGGDEFVVLLPGHDLAAARAAVEPICRQIARACAGADGRPLSSRWGLGELRPEISLGDALAAADMELLEQKGSPSLSGRLDPVPPLV